MAAECKLPELGENISSATVVRVLVGAGDAVAAGQPLIEVETNKVTVEVPSPLAGVVTEVRAAAGDEVSVGQTILLIGDASESARPSPAEAVEVAPPAAAPAVMPTVAAAVEDAGRAKPPDRGASAPSSAARVPASPSVRRFAREIGIDLARVPGSGPDGRVSVDDVKRHARRLHEAMAVQPPVPGAPPLPPLPDFAKWGPIERERMSGIRRATAEHLTHCWTQIAHVTHCDRADVTELDALRRRYADRAEQAGGKLTMAVMLVKVAASALKVFPRFNATIDLASREIIYKRYVHVGIAVNTDRGLLVPVLRDVDRKNMVQIAVEVSRIAERARKGLLAVEDMQGGTFTVTNLGNIGGTHFTPIVNYPEVAILGMGRAATEAGFDGKGAVVPRSILPLSLSYDHRLIDGAEAARFMRWIVEAVEQPLLLALEG